MKESEDRGQKTVIYRSPFIPAEWIDAHGLKPVRFIPHHHARGPIPDSEGTCPFMREFINGAAESDASAVIITTMCDQMRHSYELIDEKKSAFLFNLPSTWQTSNALKLYISELKRLGSFLKAHGGITPSGEELSRVMLQYQNRRQDTAEQTRETKLPVALIGGAMTGADSCIVDLIMEMGGTVVLDGTEAGERTLPAGLNKESVSRDPLTALAEAYFLSIPDAFQRPDTRLHSWLELRIAETQPRGLIFLRQLWCDLWHAEVERIRPQLKIPMLDIDLNGTESIPRAKTRIEAFMEAIK